MNVLDAFKDRVRPATKQDAAYIARHLRYDDLEEILVGKEITPSQILKEAWEASRFSYVYTLPSGKPICIWGVVPTDHGACIWMLGTDDLDFAKTDLLRISKWFVAESLERYGALYNWVDQRNTKSIRYLTWLGFIFGEPVDHAGYPFIPFWMSKQKESEHV
jgi:hypothetical protein